LQCYFKRSFIKDQEIVMHKYAASCGLFCGACSSMILFEKAQGVDSAVSVQMDIEESPCGGCRAPEQQNCEFIQCAKAHGVESCAFCEAFPCEQITRFSQEEWEHHQVVLDNLYRIKEIGIDAWVEEQQQHWQCSACGTRAIWYQRQCSKCGARLDSYI